MFVAIIVQLAIGGAPTDECVRQGGTCARSGGRAPTRGRGGRAASERWTPRWCGLHEDGHSQLARKQETVSHFALPSGREVTANSELVGSLNSRAQLVVLV